MRAETMLLCVSVLALNTLTVLTLINPNLVSQLKNKPVGHTRYFYRLTVNYPWSKPEPLRRTLRRAIKYRGRAAFGIHCINDFNVTGTASGGNCKTYSHKTFNTPLSSPPWVLRCNRYDGHVFAIAAKAPSRQLNAGLQSGRVEV